jgi:hypothetical protein
MSQLRDILIASGAAIVVVVAYLISDAFPPLPQPTADELLAKALDRKIEGDVEIVGTLEDAIAKLIQFGALLQVRHSEVHDSVFALPLQATIAVRLRDATVDQWLRSIEFQIPDRTVVHWTDAEGRIQITRAGRQNPPRTEQFYDVRGIVLDAQSFSSLFPTRRFERNAFGWVPSDPREVAEADLIELVRRFAGLGTWDYIGSGSWPSWGHSGMIDGRMIITQTPQIQREIEVILSALRAASARKLDAGGS